MVTAIVFIRAEAARIPEVAQELADLDGVSEVYSVTGDLDLIAVVRVRSQEEVSEVITGHLTKVDGVLRTETHIAFRSYSRHDLDAAFSIGSEAE